MLLYAGLIPRKQQAPSWVLQTAESQLDCVKGLKVGSSSAFFEQEQCFGGGCNQPDSEHLVFALRSDFITHTRQCRQAVPYENRRLEAKASQAHRVNLAAVLSSFPSFCYQF